MQNSLVIVKKINTAKYKPIAWSSSWEEDESSTKKSHDISIKRSKIFEITNRHLGFETISMKKKKSKYPDWNFALPCAMQT